MTVQHLMVLFILQIIEPQDLNEILSGWRVQNDTAWRDEYIIFAERKW